MRRSPSAVAGFEKALELAAVARQEPAQGVDSSLIVAIGASAGGLDAFGRSPRSCSTGSSTSRADHCLTT